MCRVVIAAPPSTCTDPDQIWVAFFPAKGAILLFDRGKGRWEWNWVCLLLAPPPPSCSGADETSPFFLRCCHQSPPTQFSAIGTPGFLTSPSPPIPPLRSSQLLQVLKSSAMAIKSYRYQAEMLVKDYVLADSFLQCISVLAGIFMCKLAYDLTHLASSYCIKGYTSLTKSQRIEWNNRGMSSVHAMYITAMSLYLVCFSNMFSDDGPGGLVVFRSSPLSIFTLGVSVGYFITDLAMIFWLYPSLGGMEYVIHHLLSVFAISYAMYSGEGQLYAFLVLISETTTPGINLRWFLDTAGMKRSKAYLINGVGMFLAWVVARILLFIYLFYHVYTHYDQTEQMDIFAYIIVLSVPSVLAIMNMVWFGKILRGLKKTLAKKQ